MKSDIASICFGLSEELDRSSFAAFLRLSGQPAFADLLASRLSRVEIDTHVDTFMALLRKHLTEDEYHRFFLNEQKNIK
ncbi:hypothetical protein [Desulfomarina sp.]